MITYLRPLHLGIKHQRIPVKTPNMNAHIESFHAILEKDCYQRYEFHSYPEVYRAVSEYVNYYNNRYRHGSIGDIPPAKYLKKLQNKEIKSTSFVRECRPAKLKGNTSNEPVT